MQDINLLNQAAIAAGRVIQAIAKKNYTMLHKSDQSPLTEADLSANQLLKECLLSRCPDYGWLSEETQDDLQRLEKKSVWIVDPLDGTKEYIHRIPEYVVSIALVEEGIPILASVFNPASEDLFYAMKGRGAWRNGKRLVCEYPMTAKINVVASRSEIAAGRWQPFADCLEIEPMGSIAYKLALVAAGKTQACFSLQPRNEWDIAAGVLLVQEAGGIVQTLSGNPVVFNQANTLVEGIIASTHTAYPGIKEILRTYYRCEEPSSNL